MAKEEMLRPQPKGQNYDEVLSNMSIEQKDNTIKQLDRQCGMLANENIKLKQQMQQVQQSEFYIVLDWNYKIATNQDNVFTPEFKLACAKRVESMLTPQEKKEEDEQ